MRLSLVSLASVVLAVGALAAEPASAQAAQAAPPRVEHAAGAPLVRFISIPLADSLKVFVLAQLEVPASVSRDSSALEALFQRARAAQVAAFIAAELPVYAWSAVVRSSVPGSRSSSWPLSALQDSPPHPPNPTPGARTATRLFTTAPVLR